MPSRLILNLEDQGSTRQASRRPSSPAEEKTEITGSSQGPTASLAHTRSLGQANQWPGLWRRFLRGAPRTGKAQGLPPGSHSGWSGFDTAGSPCRRISSGSQAAHLRHSEGSVGCGVSQAGASARGVGAGRVLGGEDGPAEVIARLLSACTIKTTLPSLPPDESSKLRPLRPAPQVQLEKAHPL